MAPMPEMTRRMFVLVPTYRIIRGVPIVHLYGVTDRGESVLAVDDRVRPYIFVGADDLETARSVAARTSKGWSSPSLASGVPGFPALRLSTAQVR